jgi:RNA polymerase sigma-70 factor (ECF subfamily)
MEIAPIARFCCPRNAFVAGYQDMMATMAERPDESETNGLIERASRGDESAWERLLARDRDRLRRMVALRMDRRLQGRVDPSDVIQEACLDAARRLDEYRNGPPIPFFLWLRLLTGQRLMDEHRRHLGVHARDAGREVTIHHSALPEMPTAALAAHLLGRLTSPSQAAIRAERRIRLQEAVNSMDPIDREILALRHYEQLSNGEVAMVLGLDKSAASKRYARALVRLKEILSARPGGFEEV